MTAERTARGLLLETLSILGSDGENWVQGPFPEHEAWGDGHGKYCVLGALSAAVGDDRYLPETPEHKRRGVRAFLPEYAVATDAIAAALDDGEPWHSDQSVIEFDDAPERTFAEVQALVRGALASQAVALPI